MTERQEAARQYVRAVLDERRWKPTELARKVGVEASTVTRFLNARDLTYSMKLETLTKISDVSGIKLSAPVRAAYGAGDGEISGPAAPPLGIIDEVSPTLRVSRSQPVVTPDGATGLAFLSEEGRAIVVEIDRDAIETLRKNLRSLEIYLDRQS